MAVNLETLVNIVKSSDTLEDLLGDPQLTYSKIVAIFNDPMQVRKLITALNVLTRNVKTLRETKVIDL